MYLVNMISVKCHVLLKINELEMLGSVKNFSRDLFKKFYLFFGIFKEIQLKRKVECPKVKII